MELICSMRRKPLKCEPPHFDGATDPEVVWPICTISTSNIIAFTSMTELSDSDGDTWGGYVYVCDLNTPWNSYKVTSTVHPVSTIEWDSEGKHLLVATTVGDVSVYGQKDYLLNEWTCLYTASFPGERIVKAIFFHNGRRLVSLDKKPDVPISERFQVLRLAPTLKGFGGLPGEGACIITGTGLVGAVTGGCGGDRGVVGTECLRANRDHVTAAHFVHKNGSILVAASCVRAGRRILRTAAVSVTRAPLAVKVTLLPTLYLPDDKVSLPVSLSWCLRDEGDCLLVASATVSLWKLADRPHPVHKLFAKGSQGSTTPGGAPKANECFNTLGWQQIGGWSLDSGEWASAVATCGAPGLVPPALCVLAARDTLHLLARDSHRLICSRGVSTITEVTTPASTPPKKTKYGPGITSGGAGSSPASVRCVDATCGVVVAVDTHAQLHIYKLTTELPQQISVQHLTSLLEYCLVSGHDCLDVVLGLNAPVLEAIYDRFTENFQRQPQPYQQYYYHTWLRLRIILCSMIPSERAQVNASNLSTLLMCSATLAACAASLRPDDKAEGAGGAVHLLHALLDEGVHADHDKSHVTLIAKVEAMGESAHQALSALQPLRRPLQRAVHAALTALAHLAHAAHVSHGAHVSHSPHQAHSYDVECDATAVAALRKLVALCRACGRLVGAGPGAAATEAISRALARLPAPAPAPALAATLKPDALKADMLDELIPVCAQNTGRVWESLARTGLASPVPRPPVLVLEYGVEPESLRYVPEPPAYVVTDAGPAPDVDAVRYMYVGWSRRVCARCGALALPAACPARHPLQRAYDARFLDTCRCGGKWSLVANT